ncbi:helix-turn-helix domain-containing protein [Vagococcus sp. WN89Y]|uniref:helix-turn-helix domain-containing protein n=1 Tax=Vagococcus sp. WN89Y TaxID=3457258 RepID=UPI003FCC5837
MDIEIVNAVVRWIDSNCDKPLKIKEIADYTGYSQRHIHNMFKKIVGTTLGKYIRQQRLCIAATKLKMTSQPIIQIAYQLNYDSQQSFCREFKKMFRVPPNTFRKQDLWDFSSYIVPFEFDLPELPKILFDNLNEQKLFGYEVNYDTCFTHHINEINPLHIELIIKNFEIYQDTIFSLVDKRPSHTNKNLVSVTAFIGTKNSGHRPHQCLLQKNITPGLYLKTTFYGTWKEYGILISRLYRHVLPGYKLKRRNARDIEVFNYSDEISLSDTALFYCDYYIPVIR